MGAVSNQLQIQNLAPPTILPTIYVTVKVGQTLLIHEDMIFQATPYYQEQGGKIASIQIVNHEVNYAYLLSQTNGANTKAYFTNNGLRIYRTTNAGLITNGLIDKDTIGSKQLFVTGVNITPTPVAVTYRATAFDGNVESNLTTNVLGRIVIKVVTAVNNRPNSLKAGTQPVIYGSLTPILGATVTHLYADPENDAPYKVRIDGLPNKGRLLYLGTDCYVGQEILYSSVQSGMLIYWNNESLSSPGQTDNFLATVCDVGSGLYY